MPMPLPPMGMPFFPQGPLGQPFMAQGMPGMPGMPGMGGMGGGPMGGGYMGAQPPMLSMPGMSPAFAR